MPPNTNAKKSSLTHLKSLSSAMKHVFENELNCDVYFTVADRQLGAHKFVLMSRSPVLNAMILNPLSETSREPIRIEDVSFEAFNEFLRYLYYEEAHVNESNAMELIYLSNKYMISRLTRKCAKFIFSDKAIGLEIVHYLERSLEWDQRQITKMCLDYIGKNAYDVLFGDEFKSAKEETVIKIISNDRMLITELSLFRSCVEWGRARCAEVEGEADPSQLQQALKNILPFIRFVLMNENVFLKEVVPLGVLSSSAVEEILQAIRDSVTSPQSVLCKQRIAPQMKIVKQRRVFTSPVHQIRRRRSNGEAHKIGKNNPMRVTGKYVIGRGRGCTVGVK